MLFRCLLLNYLKDQFQDQDFLVLYCKQSIFIKSTTKKLDEKICPVSRFKKIDVKLNFDQHMLNLHKEWVHGKTTDE